MRPQITPSLAIFLAVVVAIGAAVGQLSTGIGVALFFLALVAIDAKPSWKRVFNTVRTGGEREGPFARAWHRTSGWNSRDDDPAR
jgi:phosphotransferase system  glucose/maltose/N-acetylglucosamine-specific IIC component